ncbi:MAG: LytR/AlgR family response regulator transcription factor [Chitinophagaceae bacterium]
MTNKYTCIIVDDNDIDRLTTLSFVKNISNFEIIGVFNNPIDAINFCQNATPSIAFFDIDMPEVTGLDLRKKLTQIPACIFVTSYPNYAVDSFDVEALDFLVKPISKERFSRTVYRINDYLDLHKKASILDTKIGGNLIYIKEGHEQIKIQQHEILYLEALKDYTSIVTKEKKYCVLYSLGNLLKEKAFCEFVRTHKSYAVQKNYIQKVHAQYVIIQNNIEIPIGRTYKNYLATIFV